MKNLIIYVFILFITSYLHVKSQCVADAGASKIICIGGNVISGGITPYIYYSWHINRPGYKASYFLDDTTLANPSIIRNDYYIDSSDFILTVTENVHLKKYYIHRNGFGCKTIKGRFV